MRKSISSENGTFILGDGQSFFQKAAFKNLTTPLAFLY
jgi:hypothetical protein